MGQTASSPAAQSPAACPIKHNAAPDAAAPAKCPIDHTSAPARCPIDHPATPHTSSPAPAQCPVEHAALDARNNMPTLSQMPAPNQSTVLPTERETSSILRDAEGARWEYPSPQQFHNALARKGWETPEEHVEMMVQIHNFLNEQAWLEILKWERKENP